MTTQAPTQGQPGVAAPPPANALCSPVLGTDPCFPTHPQVVPLTGSQVALQDGPASRSSLNLPLLKANCFRPDGNTGLTQWGRDRDDGGGLGVCRDLGDDD